jgi:hypothetical protein
MIAWIKKRLGAFVKATAPDAPYTPIADRVRRTPPRSIEGRPDPYRTLRPSTHQPRHMGTSSATLVIRQPDDPRPMDEDWDTSTEDMPRVFEVPEWLRGTVSNWDMVIRRRLAQFDARIHADDPHWPRVQDSNIFRRRTASNWMHWHTVDTDELFRTGDIHGVLRAINRRAQHSSNLVEDTLAMGVPVFAGVPEDDE